MFLHLSEGVEDGEGVRQITEAGGRDAPPGHHQRDLTVDVSLVSLSQHLVNVSSNVGSDLGKGSGVVKLDGKGDYSSVVYFRFAEGVGMRGSQHNVTIGRLLVLWIAGDLTHEGDPFTAEVVIFFHKCVQAFHVQRLLS